MQKYGGLARLLLIRQFFIHVFKYFSVASRVPRTCQGLGHRAEPELMRSALPRAPSSLAHGHASPAACFVILGMGLFLSTSVSLYKWNSFPR